MEGCKERAREAGLRFQDETLEYIVTNRDLLELSGKLMIPTLYDYWVHDVEVIREKGRYELYPGNPFETVVNTRPAISFYNDNNPDWLNVMIFYHVLAHIDFFQNNLFFQHTWDDDFAGRALADKRLIAKLRSEKGRWVDYIIEFTRGIDNLIGFPAFLSRLDAPAKDQLTKRIDFYFDVFLQTVKAVKQGEYFKEIEHYNRCIGENPLLGEDTFLSEVDAKYPEFQAVFEKLANVKPVRPQDLIEYIAAHSEFLKKEKNRWMQSVIQVVRNTALFFAPQLRTKIMNEGWASYWHDKLFFGDSRISGHEVDFARVHAGVASLPRVGLNPYALGMRLFQHIEEGANRGKYSLAFNRLSDTETRKKYDAKTGRGKEAISNVRKNFCDHMFVNTYLDQEFVDQYNLFVAGRRLNADKSIWEYFIKSRTAADYRQMVMDTLYHPPSMEVDTEKGKNGTLHLMHRFEGKPLVKHFIRNTMLGIEFLWGRPVQLETRELVALPQSDTGGSAPSSPGRAEGDEAEKRWQRVVYIMADRKLSQKII
jgi:stage V sporulation protein R